jgi:hypothetical protein
MKRSIVILLLHFPFVCLAQKSIYMKAVAGNYWMGDMKGFLDELRKDFVLPTKTVNNFSMSVQGEVGLDYKIVNRFLDEYTVGGFLNYAITRGRANYTDYSGSADLYNDLWRIQIGARGLHPINEQFSIYGKVGLCLSSLKIRSAVALHGSGSESDEVSFDAYGFTLEPGIQWRKTVYRKIILMGNFGYELNVNSKTNYDGDSWLIDTNDDPVRLDWSGFRLGVGVGLSLEK